MKTKKIHILLVVYGVILLQFIVSNFYVTIGKNYTLNSAVTSYNSSSVNYYNPKNDMFINCPEEAQDTGTTIMPEVLGNVGFPFGVAVKQSDPCYPSQYGENFFQAFNIDRILNFIYIGVISIISGSLYLSFGGRFRQKLLWYSFLAFFLFMILSELSFAGFTYIIGVLAGLAFVIISIVKIIRRS
jgi:hypothetical protein